MSLSLLLLLPTIVAVVCVVGILGSPCCFFLLVSPSSSSYPVFGLLRCHEAVFYWLFAFILFCLGHLVGLFGEC